MIRVHLKRDATPAEIQSLCDAYIARLAEEVPNGPGYRILPGIPELLEALKRRTDMIMGLGTGNLKAGAEIKLKRPNFWRYFDFGGFSNDSEVRAEVLAAGVKRGEALAKKTFAPRNVIVIGDNSRDIEAGKAIGATTIGVATGPMKLQELAAFKPDHLFVDLSDTGKVIETLVRPI
jgi:phosphoglycolate phosphatase-like HAD superfamily hydrolase